jgi:ornithine carbamoyltransferase
MLCIVPKIAFVLVAAAAAAAGGGDGDGGGAAAAADTIRTVENYADCIVLRHFQAGSAKRAASVSSIPILNAGVCLKGGGAKAGG